MTERARSIKIRFGTALACAAIAVIAILGFTNRQLISDQISIWGFTPSPSVTQVQERMQLTDRGDFVFLASNPTLESSSLFNDQCAQVDHSEEGHVLGCFTGSRIHLFMVDDERLDGIVDVTAAHELLHAVYARLTDGEKADLNKTLNAEYQKLSKSNPELTERMSVYQSLPEDRFVNELHSVLGTEVGALSGELEKHYAETFRDRAAVVTFFDNYHAVFTSLQDEAEKIESEMSELGESIETRSTTYQEDLGVLNADIASFNQRLSDGEISSQTQYNTERSALVTRADALEAARNTLKTDVTRYKDLRKRLLELDAKSKELNRVINSNLAPAPSL
ncbi:hypothetical protein GCM10022198_05580 [Klugiella xanthotipulae]|uniref:Uncharacterized protein n=1 Tax=Klugiella xanthotipulae TaxID=244735 RepID=A0A543HS72_9MICO|nr:hypothetical protein [Klugiella xanthotipulae]TQM61187.1 hypothetical protein FB466_2124 [Klugiella xanthotipulae]